MKYTVAIFITTEIIAETVFFFFFFFFCLFLDRLSITSCEHSRGVQKCLFLISLIFI